MPWRSRSRRWSVRQRGCTWWMPSGFSPSYFLAAGCLLVAICGVGLIREPYRERLRYELKLDRMFAPEAVGKGVALMLLATSFSCMGAYVVLYGYSVGVSQMGVFFIVYSLCLLGTRPLFGSMADRFGAPRVLLVASRSSRRPMSHLPLRTIWRRSSSPRFWARPDSDVAARCSNLLRWPLCPRLDAAPQVIPPSRGSTWECSSVPSSGEWS